MNNRRNFLKNASLLTVGGLLSGEVSKAVGMTYQNNQINQNKIVGLQTYSVLRELNQDIPAGMKKLKQIGYTNLELSGYADRKLAGLAVTEYRKLVEEIGRASCRERV